VQFLVQEKGPEAFTAFLRCSNRGGPELALRRHYGMTFEDLETRWSQYVLARGQMAENEVLAKRGEAP
jgi:hypothetical protein